MIPSPLSKMTLLSQAAIVLCTFIGASTIVLAEPLVGVVPPILLLAIRFLLAALLLAVTAPRRVFPLTCGVIRAGSIAGVGFGLGCALLYAALPHVRAGKLTFLIALEVVIVPVISTVVYGQKLNRFEVIAFALSVFGLWLIVGDGHSSFSWWDIVGLASALAYAVYTLALSRLSDSGGVFSRTFVSFFSISILSIIASCFFESSHSVMWDARIAMSLLYLVVVGSVARFLIQAWAQKTVSASFTALTFTAEPVFAIGLSYMFLGERFSTMQTYGAVVIIAALIFANMPRVREAQSCGKAIRSDD
jgi:drug/metabolite transporter (DMT)-like permease